jgi:outer membrane lipoprotein LolB
VVKSTVRALAATVLLALTACAELTPREGTQGIEFELTGRIAVRYDNEGSSGNIAWRHASHDDEMLITSPLGQGVARITRKGDAVTLTASDGRVYHARDAETLTEKVLKFRVPLAGLADWIRGRAAPGPALATRDAQGRLTRLVQDGWRIDYLAYADNGALPSRLRLTYPGIELRLAVGEWQRTPGQRP